MSLTAGFWKSIAAFLLVLSPLGADAGLTLESIGKTYSRNSAVTPGYLSASQSASSGSTSVRRDGRADLEWKPASDDGYFQRNRDLGQVFNLPAGATIKIDSIVLRTGNSSTAVKSGAPNAPVFLQIFEVTGTPVINDNGTPVGTRSTHGFNTNHRTDDFLDGLTYTSLMLTSGGTFPNVAPTTVAGDPQGRANFGQPGHLLYIRWNLTGSDEIELSGGAAGKRFAFMVGFSEDRPDQGFTIGNFNDAANTAAPALRKDINNKQWWCIRREGDGTLPPTQIPGATPPSDPLVRQGLENESLFKPNHQLTLPPTCDGFPDVDTYREFEFYIETKAIPVPPAETMVGSIRKTQDFSTDPGWVGSGNSGGGSNFGYSSTANAGVTPAGEIGGLFDQGAGYSSYVDTDGNYAFAAGETVRGSGTFIIKTQPGNTPNTDVYFGHLTTTGDRAPNFMVGFLVREPSGSPDFRLEFGAGAGGASFPSKWQGTVSKDIAHKFSYEWRGNGTLIVMLDSIQILNTTVVRPSPTTNFGGFGMASRNRSTGTNGQGYNVYLDNVDYSFRSDGMKIISVSYAAGTRGIALRYQSLDGMAFQVERSPDLKDPWTPLPDTVMGDGTLLQYPDTPPSGDRFFYRMKAP